MVKRTGRPRSNTKLKKKLISLIPEMDDELRSIAQRLGVAQNAIVVMALSEYLDRQNNQK